VLYDFDDLVKKGLLKFTDDLDKCMQPVAQARTRQSSRGSSKDL